MSKKDKSKDKTKKEDPAIETMLNDEAQVATEEAQEDSLQQELEKEKERYLRLFAEFENYKRRTNKERLELFASAGQEVMKALLPVMDDFDRALAEIEKSEDDSLFQGVQLIHHKLQETLKAKGLETINVKQGDVFDADDHEAITQIPAPSKDLKGKIIDVVEKGYKMGEKVLRYPKVVIGQQ